MSANLPEPSLSVAPTVCPFCRSTKIGTADEKASSSAYWRCEACGEVWNVARLRAPSRYGYEGRRNGTSMVVADWIKRIVEDERKRDAVRVGEAETAARRADLVRLNGRRLVDELRAAVTRDVEAFREEFVGDRAHEIVLETTGSEGGFGVSKPASPAASLTVTPRLEAASAVCHYRFTPTTGLPPREDRVELAFSGDGGGMLRMKHLGTGQVFATADALSEFLLGPVFTGRPR